MIACVKWCCVRYCKGVCDFTSRDESEVVIHSDDAFAPVGFLRFKKMHVQEKEVAKVIK